MAEEVKEQVKLEGKMAEFVAWIETISVLELSQLVKALEQRLGVSAAAPMAAMPAAGAAAGAAGAPAAVEKTEFTVVIKDVGPKKIDVIKAIRQITTLGLKDAKDLAETAGAKVLEAAGKDAAMDAKSKLEAAGAVIELI